MSDLISETPPPHKHSCDYIVFHAGPCYCAACGKNYVDTSCPRCWCAPSVSSSAPPNVEVITKEGRAEARVCDLTDVQLENAIGNTAADLALAEKYEHNAHLRPAIRAQFDLLDAERKRRTSSAEPAPPTPVVKTLKSLDSFLRAATIEVAAAELEAKLPALRIALEKLECAKHISAKLLRERIDA